MECKELVDVLTAQAIEKLAIGAIEQGHRNAQIYRNRARALAQSVAVCKQTGVGYATQAIESTLSEVGRTARGFFEQVAKEAGKILMLAQLVPPNYTNAKVIQLTVPKRKRMENVIAGLLLVAVKSEDTWMYKYPELGDVVFTETAGQWKFYFSNDGGRELFDSFVEQCRTDPVFKIVLSA